MRGAREVALWLIVDCQQPHGGGPAHSADLQDHQACTVYADRLVGKHPYT